jgi:hypothetical protein
VTVGVVIRALLLALGSAGMLLAGYGACGGSTQGGAGGVAGGGGGATGDAGAPPDAHPPDGGTDADAAPPWGTLPPWDPVWHETKPYTWPEVPHDNMPDCGAGCTAISAYPPFSFNAYSLDGKQVAYSTIVDGPAAYVLLVNVDTMKEYLIDDGKGEPHLENEGDCRAEIPALDGDRVVYALVCDSHTRLVLRSLITGETKTLALFGALSAGAPGRTGLTKTDAYWSYGNNAGPNSISSLDLQTGEVKTTENSVDICRTLWFRAGPKGDEVLCTNEDAQQILMIDIAGQTTTALSPSPYAENYGYLSPDGTEAVWLDYRDPGPNGEHGSYDFEFAGEIYYKNLVTGVEKRITFDNPTDPVKKQFPSIRNGIIAWQDWRTLPNKNPQGGTGFAIQAAPIRYQTGLDGGPVDCPFAGGLNPEATDKGIIVHGGGVLPDGSTREALVLLACP